jgi:hypothetical protein
LAAGGDRSSKFDVERSMFNVQLFKILTCLSA